MKVNIGKCGIMRVRLFNVPSDVDVQMEVRIQHQMLPVVK